MAQLRVQITDPRPAIRQGAGLQVAGGRVTQGVGQAAGPPDIARADLATAAQPYRALDRLGDAATQWATVSLRAEEADKIGEAKVSAITRLGELQGQVLAEAADPRAGMELWRQRSTAVRDEIARTLPGNLNREFQSAFADIAATRGLNVQNGLAERQTQRVAENLRERLMGLGNEAAVAGNPAAEAATRNAALGLILEAERAGSITPARAGELRRGFLGDVDEAKIRRAMAANPGAAIALINDTTQTPNIAADRRASLLNSAVTAQQGQAAQSMAGEMRALSLESARARAEDRVREMNADEAEKRFVDAQRAGNTAGAAAALEELRRVGRPGAYASASDSFYGRREPPTSPQMRTWLADRQDGRGGVPLTRAELESARASGSINDTIYREGIDALRNREAPNYRQAEEFLDNALGTPSPTIADRDLQPWQRQARAQRGAILNDLRLELRRNPDTDPVGFVQDRIRSAPDPAREIERARARQALTTSVPEAARTPDGIAELQSQLSAYQAFRNSGWFARQGMATVPQPTVDVGGSRRPVSTDDLARWKRIVEQAQ